MILDHTPEALKRAQRNGAKKRNGSSKVSPAHKVVINVLTRRGPMLLNEIAEATGKVGGTLSPLLNSMESFRQVIVIGTAEQMGKTAVRRDARVWALPGMPKLPPLPATIARKNICAKNAPRRYQYQWLDLERDLRAHQNLAMAIQR